MTTICGNFDFENVEAVEEKNEILGIFYEVNLRFENNYGADRDGNRGERVMLVEEATFKAINNNAEDVTKQVVQNARLASEIADKCVDIAMRKGLH